MFPLFFRFAIVSTLSLTSHLAAADEIGRIKKELLSLLERIEALEAENKQLKAVTDGYASSKKITVKGDLRYRYEDIKTQGKPDRERSRVRARISSVAKPTNCLLYTSPSPRD